MNRKLYIANLIVILCLCFSLKAQNECSLDISIANITKGDVVPEAINSKLEGKLTQVLGRAGIVTAPYDSRFFIAGRFDDAINDITGGPSPKTYVKTTLTLYVGDADEQKVFASKSFEISGVGATEQQAYTKALNKLNLSNKDLDEFITTAHKRIIDFYDSHYNEYLTKAKEALANRNYDEAMYYAATIPSCCKGYSQAHSLIMGISEDRINYDGNQLLAKAKAAWAADPSAKGAAEAHKYLTQIDPSASCAKEAQTLSQTISKTTQKQWEFENVTKYNNSVALEKERIRAAKEVGVAWAKSRPKIVNRYVFLRRY